MMFARLNDRDEYFMDGLSIARRALGARGFNENTLDKITAGVMTAVDTYTLIQDFQDGDSG